MMELTWQSGILAIGVVLGSYFLLRRNPRLKHHIDLLGGPKAYPVVGVGVSFMRPHREYIPMIDKWLEEYGPICGSWIGNFIPLVFITEPKAIEKVLSTTSHIDKAKYIYNLFHDWLGTGLLTASRAKWSTRRKLLTPSFHFKILEDFIPVFNEQASILMDCLEKETDNGKSFDIYPYICRCTLDIICETAMGKKINAQTSTVNKKYIDAVNGMCAIIGDKTMKPWLRLPIISHLSSLTRMETGYLKILKGFTKQVIQSRKLERSQKSTIVHNKAAEETAENAIYGKQRKAFLDLLLDTSENGKILTDSDILEEVDTFMFEGHDTTGVSLAWTILLLASHPEYQQKVHQELDEIFGDDPERNVTTADIAKMKYLECCMKESLRLYPSVPFIMRHTDNDIVLEDGRIIPQGATSVVAIHHVHRNPAHFPEPTKFKPERFTLENSLKRHPYAYVPFSAGPRNCIGQKFAIIEEKVILATLFRKYRLEADANQRDNIHTLPAVILRSEEGIQIYLHKRT